MRGELRVEMRGPCAAVSQGGGGEGDEGDCEGEEVEVAEGTECG